MITKKELEEILLENYGKKPVSTKTEDFITSKSEGRTYDWDLSIPSEIKNVLAADGTVSSGEEWEYKFFVNYTNDDNKITYEIKFDGSALTYGNIFIETHEWKNDGWVETGIYKSKATIWVQIIPTPMEDIIPIIYDRQQLLNLINFGLKNKLVRESISNHEKTSKKRNKGVLIPIGLIAPHLTQIFQQDDMEYIILTKKQFESIQ